LRELKFGLTVPQGWKLDLPEELPPKDQFELIVRTAKDAERLEYDFIWLYDNFHAVLRWKTVLSSSAGQPFRLWQGLLRGQGWAR
jgi:hypothetical protein